MKRKRNKQTQQASLDELLKEMWKTVGKDAPTGRVFIRANRQLIEAQRRDIKVVEKLLDDIKAAEDHDEVMIKTAIAVGYANAMQAHGIITEGELQRMNAVIGTIGERRLIEVDGEAHRTVFKFECKLNRDIFKKMLNFGKGATPWAAIR